MVPVYFKMFQLIFNEKLSTSEVGSLILKKMQNAAKPCLEIPDPAKKPDDLSTLKKYETIWTNLCPLRRCRSFDDFHSTKTAGEALPTRLPALAPRAGRALGAWGDVGDALDLGPRLWIHGEKMIHRRCTGDAEFLRCFRCQKCTFQMILMNPPKKIVKSIKNSWSWSFWKF